MAGPLTRLNSPILRDSNATNGGANALEEQYPHIAGFLKGLQGTAPDEVGGSVLDGSHSAMSDGAGYGFPIGTAAQALPVIGPALKWAMTGSKAARVAGAIGDMGSSYAVPKRIAGIDAPAAAKGLGFDPVKLRTQYPDMIPPVMATDAKSGKRFLQKVNSPEAEAVAKARQAAQADIDKGNYTPMFDVANRTTVNPADYPRSGNTLVDTLPKKQETIDAKYDQYDHPAVWDNLLNAYHASNDDPLAHNFYHMGQLRDAYVSELGPEAGSAAFKTDFADPMAATTGGADPKSNLMMAHYGNYLKAQGASSAVPAYQMPFPIGGRYASGNMEMYDNVMNQGKGLTAEGTPKRYNFSGNFLGHGDHQTIDEQMSTLFPDLSGKIKAAPMGNEYGIQEDIANNVAHALGVEPRDFQSVAWAGAKGTQGQPMIDHINQMIERTSRINGLPPSEVLKGYINKTMPMFGGAGAAVGADQLPQGTAGPLSDPAASGTDGN